MRFIPTSCPGPADPGSRSAIPVSQTRRRTECADLDGQRGDRNRAGAAQIGAFTRGWTALADHAQRAAADADALAVPCRTPGPRGWRPRSGPWPTAASGRNHAQREADDASPASPPGRQLLNHACDRRCPGCHMRSDDGARCSMMPPKTSPKRRSDDGQTIFKAALEG